MALHMLIRTPSGEEMLVRDLAGHEDCELLEEGVSAPRIAGCVRINGHWRINKEIARRAIRVAQLADPERALGVIEALEARVAALEAPPSPG